MYVSRSKLHWLKNVTQGAGNEDAPLWWEVVKTNSQKPPQPEEHAGVLYKGKYYISGGCTGSTIKGPTDDLCGFSTCPISNGLL